MTLSNTVIQDGPLHAAEKTCVSAEKSWRIVHHIHIRRIFFNDDKYQCCNAALPMTEQAFYNEFAKKKKKRFQNMVNWDILYCRMVDELLYILLNLKCNYHYLTQKVKILHFLSRMLPIIVRLYYWLIIIHTAILYCCSYSQSGTTLSASCPLCWFPLWKYIF